MAEIVGTIAAASQLAKYLVDICDVLYVSVNTSRILENHKVHVQELKTICTAIRESPSLQTSEVISCISQIIDAIDQSIIFSILKKPRSLRWFIFFISQKPLLEFFQRLESHKTSLNLCVTAIHTSKLNTIHDTVQALYSAKDQAPTRSAQAELNTENEISDLSSSMPKCTEASGRNCHNQMPVASSAERHRTAHTGTKYSGHNHEGATGHHHVGPTVGSETGQKWKEVFGNDVYEHNNSKNGDDRAGGSKTMHVGPEFEKGIKPEETGGAYISNVKYDNGLQQVGPVVHFG
ncbi:hypothetical protein GQX73_g6535 [Xylaria multiplex]|uniref:Uncharacterized protein n=1 Tax=Xylaria multiplex TaxID=323545 RepID=A0A7C8IPN9_9PEZI|nr:hypothetical protein GQX73_g6535 [Xylaria multiplex]